MDDLILSSGDFQCPDSGEPVEILWNVDKEILYSEPCSMALWDRESSEDTIAWCKWFGRHCDIDSAEAANRVIDKYGLLSDCGFAEED